MPRIWIIILAISIWLGLIVWANKILLEYDNQVYETNNHPQTWPAKTKITFSLRQPSLLMFVHPRCPCTRASLEELNRLVTNFPNRLNCWIIFLKPETVTDNWYQTDLWRKANKMKDLRVYLDQNGKEATLFSVKSSGRVLLYDTNMHLIFSGGLTASRGHEGDNLGKSTIEKYLKTHKLTTNSSPSFGCPLF